jgi:hypothetical protein
MRRVGLIAALAALVVGLATATAVAQEPQEQPAKPIVVQHDLEGRDACLACHGGAMEAIPGVPASHTSRTNDTCLWCHAADAEIQTTDPKTIQHDLEGRSACLMCHAAGAMEAIPDVPPTHEGRTDQYCTLCHQMATG